MNFIGIDLGTSSIKVTILNSDSGQSIASDFFPKVEMKIDAPQAGFAEQHPEAWWKYTIRGIQSVIAKSGVAKESIKGIGIAYQMHGLVCLDKNGDVVRPAIIWCDSRAVPYGGAANDKIGPERSLQTLLNSPGNFTAAKLAWVKDHQPEIYERINKICLPGDYLAYKFSHQLNTTTTGLSEGIFWDFQQRKLSKEVLRVFDFEPSVIPDQVPIFGEQGFVTDAVKKELGLSGKIGIYYRAGDQPNNAWSLNVLNPGESAATAGTSGVIYAVTDKANADPKSRINTFVHVNDSDKKTRLGMLLCLNGCGIAYAWMHRLLGQPGYDKLNQIVNKSQLGADGLFAFPFGNGVERMLGNKPVGAQFKNIDFNRHDQSHLARATMEGIAFALHYGLEILSDLSTAPQSIKAAEANLFLSPLFRQSMANLTGANIELFDTDGSLGAARGAAVGAKAYATPDEAFQTMKSLSITRPDEKAPSIKGIYQDWKRTLLQTLND